MKSKTKPTDFTFEKICLMLHFFLPILAFLMLYRFIRRLVISNVCQYEDSVKKREEFFQKVTKQLKILMKPYENLYFYFMPMNHGTTLPQTYPLFIAIKEILMSANKPATRVIRTNLLFDLIYGDHSETLKDCDEDDDQDLLNIAPDDPDPLAQYNLDLMQCSRALIIQGVKDFEVMQTVYRVMETMINEDLEES